MKRNFISALMLIVASPLVGLAQGNQEDIAILQNVLGREKKEIVARVIDVDSASYGAFWKTYNDYENERKKIGREHLEVLNQYLMRYDALNDDNVSQLVDGAFGTEGSLLALHKKYFKKFSKEIGKLKAAKLMQLESYVHNVVELDVQERMPFIDEIKD